METPSRSQDASGEDAGRWTPFRERAVEERRLRDELALSATPGLKRRLEPWNDASRVRREPEELKSYLRDLSAVLALQEGKNLTQVLANAEEQAPGGPEQVSESEAELNWSPKNDLKDSVFSSLAPYDRSGAKLRRVQSPLVIRDAERVAERVEERVLDVKEAPVLAAEPIYDDFAGFDAQEDGEPLTEAPDEQEDLKLEPEPHNLSEESFSTDSEPDEPEPLSTSRLRRCLALYIEKEDLRIGKQGWTALQRASESLLKGMAQEMKDEEDRIIPDRQHILSAFERFRVIPPNSGNEALFEICCKYLTLEDLNTLESALFP